MSTDVIGDLVEDILDKLRGAIGYRLTVAVHATEVGGHQTTDMAVYISGVEAWHGIYQGVLLACREHLGGHLGFADMTWLEAVSKFVVQQSVQWALTEYLDGKVTADDLRWDVILDDMAHDRDTPGRRLATAAALRFSGSMREPLRDGLAKATIVPA